MQNIASITGSKRFILWAALLLGGCGSLGWDILAFPGFPNPTEGALNVGNARPPVLRRCTQAFNAYPVCKYGFTDSNNNILNIYEDLMVKLDAHGEQVPELKPWVKRIDTRNAPDEWRLPYKLYLLTISPAIVLAVPATATLASYYDGRNCRTLLISGCIQSQGFRGNAYWFHESPLVANDSFWFTPEDPKGTVHYLNNGRTSHEIVAGQSAVRLTKNQARWSVERFK